MNCTDLWIRCSDLDRSTRFHRSDSTLPLTQNSQIAAFHAREATFQSDPQKSKRQSGVSIAREFRWSKSAASAILPRSEYPNSSDWPPYRSLEPTIDRCWSTSSHFSLREATERMVPTADSFSHSKIYSLNVFSQSFYTCCIKSFVEVLRRSSESLFFDAQPIVIKEQTGWRSCSEGTGWMLGKDVNENGSYPSKTKRKRNGRDVD